MIAFDDLRDFLGSLTRATSEGAAFSALEKRSARLHNHVLFTCLRFDYRDQVMLRLYSNREEVSPIGGQKPLPSGPWADRLIQEGRSYIGRSRQDLKEVFFDYEPLWAIRLRERDEHPHSLEKPHRRLNQHSRPRQPI